jgi:hypothetical protein
MADRLGRLMGKRWRWTHADGPNKARRDYDHKAKREPGSLGPNCVHCGARIVKEAW